MKLVRSTENSLAGLAHALKTERALQMEVAVLVAFVPLSLIVGTDLWQRAVLIASGLFVIAVELLNTCVEKLCDHVTPVLHPQGESGQGHGLGRGVLFAAGGRSLVARRRAGAAGDRIGQRRPGLYAGDRTGAIECPDFPIIFASTLYWQEFRNGFPDAVHLARVADGSARE